MKELSKKFTDMNASSIRVLAGYADQAEKQGKKIYRLNIGQPDLHVPDEYYEEVRRFHAPVIEYMASPGLASLRQTMADYYNEAGIDADKDDFLVTAGGTEAIMFSYLALTNPGDEFIVFEPYYSNYNTLFTIAGAKPAAVTTLVENGFHFRREDLEAKINDKTKAIMVTSPGNPTGTVLTDEEMDVIADAAKKYDLFVIADEVYREMVFDGGKVKSFGHRKDIYDRLIIVDSVSKRFNACGTRIGSIFTKNKEAFAIMEKLCQGRLSVSTIEQHGAIGLYSTRNKLIGQIRDEFEKRRDIVYEAMRLIPGVVVTKPEGAFYVMAKLPIDDADRFSKWMLTEFEYEGETVMAASGASFYATEGLGKNEIRIAYVLKEKDLQRALFLLKKGLEEYSRTVL